MKIAVLHPVRGMKLAVLEAPCISKDMVAEGMSVALFDEPGGEATGGIMVHKDGLVLVWGTAYEQYGPITKPPAGTEPGS